MALNCVANGKVLRDGRFERIWMQPAAGDAGGALGAALAAYHIYHRQAAHASTACSTPCRAPISARHFAQEEIERAPDRGRRQVRRADDAKLIDAHAPQALADEKAVGWFQGRMEFGPRALGGRSILGDPRSPDDADDAESQGQIPRELPALRARRCCARMSPTGSSSTATAPTCCWSPTCVERSPPRDDEDASSSCSASTS